MPLTQLICGHCGAEFKRKLTAKQLATHRYVSCSASCRSKQQWQDPEYRSAVLASRIPKWTPERRQKSKERLLAMFADEEYMARFSALTSQRMIEQWADPEYKEKTSRNIGAALSKWWENATDEDRAYHSHRVRERITPEFRLAASRQMKANWEKYREKWMANVKTGPDNNLWRGGTSFEPYGPGFNAAKKRQVSERDSHMCQECGAKKEDGGQFHCHHIDYDKQNSAIDNLILLCHSCHSKANFNRDDWQRHYEQKRANKLTVVEKAS